MNLTCENCRHLYKEKKKAEAELAEAKAEAADSTKFYGWASSFLDEIVRLREALEEIQRHYTCTAYVADIVNDALGGGQGGEYE